jgi:hypothetical protein
MKSQEFNNLSKEEQLKEIEKCQSFEYFYNNYCKKEGMPEYSKEAFEEYKIQAEQARLRNGYSRRGKTFLMREYPLTPEEVLLIDLHENNN